MSGQESAYMKPPQLIHAIVIGEWTYNQLKIYLINFNVNNKYIFLKKEIGWII